MIKIKDQHKYFEYLRELDDHHYLFYYLWQMGKPQFTEEIDTAAVKFINGYFAGFTFNPHFWNGLSKYERQFVICHESLHLALNHGMRTVDTKDKQIANIAMDIVVNELLVDMFGFEREKITIPGCWADILGPDTPTDRNFEYYFNLLKENAKEVPYYAIDDHSGFDGESTDEVFKEIDLEELTEFKKEIEDHTPGNNPGGLMVQLNVGIVKKKPKWESVIKKWYKKHSKEKSKMTTHWLEDNRRTTLLSRDLMLPYEKETRPDFVKKVSLWCFQDTSASCRYDAERFFKALKSIPTRYFDIRVFCFDTSVKETDLKNQKLYGFGGTCFACIERSIHSIVNKDKCKYPQAVFVFTDGCGTYVYPQYPDRWHWFLKEGGIKAYIPEESKVFDLSQYE